jgi:hypothetical protein
MLATLVTLFLVASLIETQTASPFSPLRITTTFVVLSAVLSTTDNRRHLLAISLLVVGWVVAAWLPVEGTVLIEDAFLIVLLFYIVFLMTVYLVSPHKITHDDISGGIAVYLCLALAWAASFRLLDGLNPDAFSVNFAGDFNAALYFSLTTITTLGYGDISPITPFARLWATLEAAVGLLYVAILVSRLVSEFQR